MVEEQGGSVDDVVITCPAYFGLEERNATKKAGELAGMNVLNLINEPLQRQLLVIVLVSSRRNVLFWYMTSAVVHSMLPL